MNEPPVAPPHDAGGKVKLALPRGMRGGATFCGPGDCYRTLLWRGIIGTFHNVSRKYLPLYVAEFE